jgi:hypothetical protein
MFRFSRVLWLFSATSRPRRRSLPRDPRQHRTRSMADISPPKGPAPSPLATAGADAFIPLLTDAIPMPSDPATQTPQQPNATWRPVGQPSAAARDGRAAKASRPTVADRSPEPAARTGRPTLAPTHPGGPVRAVPKTRPHMHADERTTVPVDRAEGGQVVRLTHLLRLNPPDGRSSHIEWQPEGHRRL